MAPIGFQNAIETCANGEGYIFYPALAYELPITTGVRWPGDLKHTDSTTLAIHTIKQNVFS